MSKGYHRPTVFDFNRNFISLRRNQNKQANHPQPPTNEIYLIFKRKQGVMIGLWIIRNVKQKEINMRKRRWHQFKHGCQGIVSLNPRFKSVGILFKELIGCFARPLGKKLCMGSMHTALVRLYIIEVVKIRLNLDAYFTIKARQC